MKDEGRKGHGLIAAIAVFKLVKAALMILVGFGAIHYLHRDLATAIDTLCHHLRADPENRFLRGLIEKATGISVRGRELIATACFIYGTLFLVEGIGLLMRQRWAEWLTIVSGALLIPFEIYELVERVKVGRIIVLILNIAIVIYLIIRVRSGGEEHQAAESREAPQT